LAAKYPIAKSDKPVHHSTICKTATLAIVARINPEADQLAVIMQANSQSNDQPDSHLSKPSFAAVA
jgi:hypothetical protein